MILDTNAVSALLAGDSPLEQLLAAEERHHLPVIVIGEYRYGLARSRYRAQLDKVFDLLIRESLVLEVVESTTRHYAEVRERLRKIGRPIPENDVWISALALQHSHAIVSKDEHFDDVEGVERVSW